jgi:hypothetical protein
MLRLFYDATGRTYAGENDMIFRVDRETDIEIKARMLFYMGLHYDIRGLPNLANRYFQQFRDTNVMFIPEWRLNEWIMTERKLIF